MQTTCVVNKIERVFTLTEQTVGDNLKTNLIRRGWDGTVWFGTSPAEGRKTAKGGIFYRDKQGNFHSAF